jgi:hypothetical protein
LLPAWIRPLEGRKRHLIGHAAHGGKPLGNLAFAIGLMLERQMPVSDRHLPDRKAAGQHEWDEALHQYVGHGLDEVPTQTDVENGAVDLL